MTDKLLEQAFLLGVKWAYTEEFCYTRRGSVLKAALRKARAWWRKGGK